MPASAWAVKPGSWALVGDVVSAHADGVSAAGYGLTLSAFTGGVRYLPPVGHSSLQAIRPGPGRRGALQRNASSRVSSGTANAGAAFAGNFGGGLDLASDLRFSVRLVEADYLLTTFDNGSNNHQNNLRISAGVVIHF